MTGSRRLLQSAPKSRPPNSKPEKIQRIIAAIHSIAGNGLDVKPQDVLSASDREGRRATLSGSARQARDWLNLLLVEPNPTPSTSTSAE